MLLSYGTAGGPVDVVQMALDHLLDMMRLCRKDNMGMRQLIPSLYIRLGKDQDAYDFMKWYATTGEEPQYDWGDMDQPFLDIKDADVLEAPARRWTKTTFLDLSHAVAVVLIKVRVLLDLQAIQNARIALRSAIPQEIIKIIRGQLVSPLGRGPNSPGQAGRDNTASRDDQSQIREVYGAVQTYNSHFWELLVKDPEAGVLQRPNGPYTTPVEGGGFVGNRIQLCFVV